MSQRVRGCIRKSPYLRLLMIIGGPTIRADKSTTPIRIFTEGNSYMTRRASDAVTARSICRSSKPIMTFPHVVPCPWVITVNGVCHNKGRSLENHTSEHIKIQHLCCNPPPILFTNTMSRGSGGKMSSQFHEEGSMFSFEMSASSSSLNKLHEPKGGSKSSRDITGVLNEMNTLLTLNECWYVVLSAA
jgi:hypothetical protein